MTLITFALGLRDNTKQQPNNTARAVYPITARQKSPIDDRRLSLASTTNTTRLTSNADGAHFLRTSHSWGARMHRAMNAPIAIPSIRQIVHVYTAPCRPTR